MSQDLWLQNYDATCRLAQEIAENIHERNRQQRTGGNPSKINMTLRASLQKLKQNNAQLKDSLLRTSSSRRMYPFQLQYPSTESHGTCIRIIPGVLSQLAVTTDNRIRNETRRVKLVETKSASCCEFILLVLQSGIRCYDYVTV
uniref:Uncharacterized protein n=1 Tax=Oryzias sinensis TaxID=183150 RepID=A0A8C7XQL0_9TELE